MDTLNKTVAIIIPAKNEEHYIEKCIQSIQDQSYSQEYIEIIICDGHSTDRTFSIATLLATQFKNVKVLINKKEAAPFAFNLGINNTDAAYIMILGAHSELEENYLSTAINFLSENENISCIGGQVINVYNNEISNAIGVAMSQPFGVGNAHFRTGTKEGYVDTVAFGLYKRDIFARIGLFDEDLIRNQDDEFNYRATKAGFRIYLLPTIRIRYYVRASFKKLWNQYYQYGFWKVFVNKKHKAVTTIRQLIPPAFVLFLTLGFILSFFHKFFFASYIGIIILYIITAFYFAISASTSFRKAFNIFVAFLYMHLSYGYGYLRGIWKIILLGRKPGKKVEVLTR